MSLYYVQKFLYELNRDPRTQERFRSEGEAVLAEYDLTDEEVEALRSRDIGLLYVLGVNGQILMHFAALAGLAWPEYLQAMRDGLDKHGPVRDGVYAETGYEGVATHTARLKQHEVTGEG
ncbi:MAG: aromatic ring-opening dioxygenase subunit LigA [SAR324 cluster bacterium]|nr:aromatic ring-opening dioxygenase subunit LigA [SAR324 cluster bacterium]